MPRADVKIRLNAPHKGQLPILNSTARFRVAFCGRRFGKTDLGVEALLIGTAALPGALLRPGIYWWVGKSWTAASMKRAWRLFRRHCGGWCQINETKGEIRLPNGSEIWLRTAEHEDALSGEGVSGMVIDEFTMMTENVWWEHLRPSLSDTLGWALFLGVPKGKNWGWLLWTKERGGEPGWKSWQMPTAMNPFILPSEIEAAQRGYPQRLFEQEYLAQVVDDAGGVFRNVGSLSTAEPADGPIAGHTYIMGVDLAKQYDFTVLDVWDQDTQTEVTLDRFNAIDYSLQKPRIIELAKRFNVEEVVVERNSIGEPIIEDLERAGLPVVPFLTTNASKASVIEGLALGCEQKTLTFINDPVAILEMQSYTMERLPSGLFRYGAPEGMHDDTVMARAFAYSRVAPVGVGGRAWLQLAEESAAQFASEQA